MDCKDVQAEIASLLYGELDTETARPFREHIETCDACGREMERQLQVVARLDQWPDVDAPLDPVGIVACASARHGPSGSLPRRALNLKRYAAAAAAVLLVAVILAVIGVEVRQAGGGLVVTLGRPAAIELLPVAGDAHRDASLQPGISRLVRRELEGDIWSLLEVVGRRLDDLSREQEEQRIMLARAVLRQREEDLRYTRNLIQRAALERASESERNRLLLEEIARFVQPAASGIPGEKQ